MKGVIWVRVSSVEQARGYSTDAQLRALREAAEQRSIEIVREFRVAESAKTSETRRRFRELVDFIGEYKPDYLIAFAIDRITRNPDDLYAIHNLIDRGGLSVLLVNQNKVINRDSPPVDKFTFMMFGNIAYLDNMQRGERVKMGMLEKARGGVFPSRVPVGYMNVPDPAEPSGRRPTVAIDPARGPLIKLAFELYARGGYSLATLRDELNRRGLKQRPTSKNPNAPISIYGLQVILGNPFYYGMVRWGKQVFKGTHEPLISTDLFNRVQARLRENCSYAKPAAKKHFAFKPFLRCGHCHAGITAEEKEGAHKSGSYVYYHCTHSKDRNCPLGNFREEKVDEMFAEALGKLYIDRDIADKIKEQLKSSHTEHEGADKRELRRLQSEYTRKTNQLGLIYDDRLDGTITKEQYKEKQVAIERDLGSIQADIEKLGRINRKYKEEGSTVIDLLNGFKDIYQAADLAGKAAILGAVVDRASLRGDNLYVSWKQPFDILFTLGEGERVLRNTKWRA